MDLFDKKMFVSRQQQLRGELHALGELLLLQTAPLFPYLPSTSLILDRNILDLHSYHKCYQFKKNTINNELPKISFKESNKNIKNIFPVTLTVLIFTSFYFLFIKDNNPQREFASVPDLPEIYLPTVEKESINNISKTNADQNISNKFKKESFNFSSAIASNKISKDADTDTITLKLLNAFCPHFKKE